MTAPRRPRTTPLPFAPPSIGDDEVREVVETLRGGWLTTGPRVRRFEEEFAAFVGAPDAVATNSCSAALHTALHVAGVGPGDAVVTTPMTFAATAHAIRHVGARVVFADVEADTLTLSPAAAEEAIVRAEREGLRVRALLPVHLAGHPCDRRALDEIALRRGLTVVEDAAHAPPARIEGRLVGAFDPAGIDAAVRRLTCFSFHATKNVTTGDGGMLVGPPDLLRAARVFSRQGIERDDSGGPLAPRYDVTGDGFKYGMTDLAAAIGIHQLRRLPAAHARRREIALRYLAAFADTPAIEPPVERAGTSHAWHLFSVRLRLDRLSIDRDRFLAELAARRIGASVHYRPLHEHTWFRKTVAADASRLPIATDAGRRLVSLPVHPGLTDDDADDVVAAVLDVCGTFAA